MSGSIARNKKAYHDYFIDETFEAGIVLTGTEVKSIRDYGLSLKESYAHVRAGELWLMGLHIKPYSQGSYNNVDPVRPRKLLLHKKEIRYLEEKTKEKGQTIVPTSIYFSKGNLVKVQVGLARGKKNYDKRASIKKRDEQRDVERALKARNQSS